MYEGESIIIRSAVAFVFLLAALSFSRASLGLVSFLSQLCRFEVARSVPFFATVTLNLGRSTFSLHQGRAAFSDPFFCGLKVYRGPKSVEDFQHNTGRVFCRNGVSTNGQKN